MSDPRADARAAAARLEAVATEVVRARTLAAGAFLDARIDKPPAVVEGMIAGGTSALLAGQHKVGKTLLMLQLAMAVATGADWLWWPTRRCPVLYLNYEVAEWSFQDRLDRAINGFCTSREQRATVRANLFVNSLPPWRINRLSDMREIRNHVESTGAGLVVLDPIRAAYTGQRNDDREVGKVAQLLLEELMQPTGTAVVLGHHLRKPPPGENSVASSWDVKGAGEWADAADGIITLRHDRKDSSRMGRLLNATLRHYEDREDVALTLQPTSLTFKVRGDTTAGPTDSERLHQAFRDSFTGELTIEEMATVLDVSRQQAQRRWSEGKLPRQVQKVTSGGPKKAALYVWEGG